MIDAAPHLGSIASVVACTTPASSIATAHAWAWAWNDCHKQESPKFCFGRIAGDPIKSFHQSRVKPCSLHQVLRLFASSPLLTSELPRTMRSTSLGVLLPPPDLITSAANASYESEAPRDSWAGVRAPLIPDSSRPVRQGRNASTVRRLTHDAGDTSSMPILPPQPSKGPPSRAQYLSEATSQRRSPTNFLRKTGASAGTCSTPRVPMDDALLLARDNIKATRDRAGRGARVFKVAKRPARDNAPQRHPDPRHTQTSL